MEKEIERRKERGTMRYISQLQKQKHSWDQKVKTNSKTNTITNTQCWINVVEKLKITTQQTHIIQKSILQSRRFFHCRAGTSNPFEQTFCERTDTSTLYSDCLLCGTETVSRCFCTTLPYDPPWMHLRKSKERDRKSYTSSIGSNTITRNIGEKGKRKIREKYRGERRSEVNGRERDRERR